MTDLSSIIKKCNQPIKKDILEWMIRSFGPIKFLVTQESRDVLESWGLKDTLTPNVYDFLFKEEYKEVKNPEFGGIIKNIQEKFGYNLEGIILFGSLFRGHYANLSGFLERLESTMDEKYPLSKKNIDKHMKYLTLCELFHYPSPSDIDLCFITRDEESVNPKDLAKILLESNYYFEHATILTKSSLDEIMLFFQDLNQPNYNAIPAQFTLLRFNDDEVRIIYPNKASTETLPISDLVSVESIKPRERLARERRDMMIDYRARLEKINRFIGTNKIYNNLYEFALNRVNQGARSDDSFDIQRVIRAFSQSFALLFNPMIDVWLKSINNHSSSNKRFLSFLNNYQLDIAMQDVNNNFRIDKWHFLKGYRSQMMLNFVNEVAPELLGGLEGYLVPERKIIPVVNDVYPRIIIKPVSMPSFVEVLSTLQDKGCELKDSGNNYVFLQNTKEDYRVIIVNPEYKTKQNTNSFQKLQNVLIELRTKMICSTEPIGIVAYRSNDDLLEVQKMVDDIEDQTQLFDCVTNDKLMETIKKFSNFYKNARIGKVSDEKWVETYYNIKTDDFERFAMEKGINNIISYREIGEFTSVVVTEKVDLSKPVICGRYFPPNLE